MDIVRVLLVAVLLVWIAIGAFLALFSGWEGMTHNPISWWTGLAVWVILPSIILIFFGRRWAEGKRDL